jgi:hypothetical protein
MNPGAPATNIDVGAEGNVSGAAWARPSSPGAELTVIGKIALELGLDGAIRVVPPEAPGWNAGTPSPIEVDAARSRRIVVRGRRSFAGRVILRRGEHQLAELPFGAGDVPAEAALANTMQTTIAGRRGDEWLVVEGANARRWCKLPKLGIVATWPSERMILTSRLCLIDVESWTVVFVMRGSKKMLPAAAPKHVGLAIVDMAETVEGAPRRPAEMEPTRQVAAIVPPAAFLDDDTTTGVRGAVDELFTTANGPGADSATRVLSAEERQRAIAESSLEVTITGVTQPAPRPSTAGLRMGKSKESGHEVSPAEEPAGPMADPSSVSQAFAALTKPDEPSDESS